MSAGEEATPNTEYGLLPDPPRRVLMQYPMDDIAAGEATNAVNGGRAAGDCLRACVASLLDLPIEDVPHFVQYVEHPEGTDSHLWFWALIGFCDAYGWRVNYATETPRGWALADGRSHRGHQHVVLVYDNKIIHDPHPSGAGLVKIDGWFTFEQTRQIDGSDPIQEKNP